RYTRQLHSFPTRRSSDLTMEDISKELEMTKGSLYYYFTNKRDLMYQCHMLVLSLAIKNVEALLYEEADAECILRKMIAEHIEYADRKSTRLNSSHVSISY